MGDNTRRGIRVALKALVPLLLSGEVAKVVTDWLDAYGATGEIRALVFLVLAFVTSLVVDAFQDATGVNLLNPRDQKAGDRVMGEGLGAKTP